MSSTSPRQSPLIRKNEGVFLAQGPVVRLSDESTRELVEGLAGSEKGRVRICAHADSKDRLHEMIIALARGSYIQPHRHLDKAESFHLIEGRLDIVLFDEAGNVTETIALAPYGNAEGLPFYYRLNAPIYHTVIVRTPHTLFHETTSGPFVPGDAEFAAWAPAPEDGAAALRFLARFD